MTPIEELLAPLFGEVSDGVCAADAFGMLLYMNPAAEALLGTTLERSRGRSQCELLCGHLATEASPECASACALRVLGGEETAVTHKGQRAQPSSYAWNDTGFKRLEKARALRVRCVLLPAGGEGARLTIIEDCSAELELERRREDWRSMVAHDLRNPLSVIFAAARELQDAAPGAAPDPELVDICVQNCRRMMSLLDRYLDVAKLESGLMDVRLARLPLEPLLKACVDEQAVLAREKSVIVELRAAQGLSVTADPDLLPRVLANLLNNAVKFAPAGGTVDVTAEADGRVSIVVITFRDSGPGIDPEELPALFDRYHQAAAGRRGPRKGTGLGLAFCREAVKAMHGTIDVQSEPGAGSSFAVRLPLAI